jgi:hypothetical protein
MLAFAHRGATVNRVKVRSRMDPVTARLRASWLLDESALQPPALPPAAILCIRRLIDPRPGTVDLHRTQLPPRGWSDAVAASVARLARHAQRPARNNGAGDAEAVMFADRAEMLACLAADWCAGRLTALWWWRALLHDVGDAQVIVRAWLESPTYIAAAIEELANRGVASTFIERLPTATTQALLDAVVVQHGLRWLAPALEAIAGARRSSTDIQTDLHVGGRIARARDLDPTIVRNPMAPWAEWVPESEPEALRLVQQCLLGIALMTRRAPAVVRTAGFAADVEQWCLDARRIEPPNWSGGEDALIGPPGRDPVYPDATATGVDIGSHTASLLLQTGRDSTSGTVDNHARRREVEERRSPLNFERASPTPLTAPGRTHSVPEFDNGSTVATRVNEPTVEPNVAPVIDASILADAPVARIVPRGQDHVAHIRRANPHTIETEIGGVFYLLNLALSLGLYGDFTTPLRPGIDHRIWDFLARAGRRLTPIHFRTDALWGLLEELAGPPDNADSDEPRRSAPWLRWLVPALHARFARMPRTVTRRRVGALVCMHRARVITSPTHVDVMFSLAELPIELRLSGLDRDPGWIPAADRVVAFHYD